MFTDVFEKRILKKLFCIGILLVLFIHVSSHMSYGSATCYHEQVLILFPINNSTIVKGNVKGNIIYSKGDYYTQ